LKIFFFAFLLFAQTSANPLATLKDEVQRVLLEAKLPFNDDQERAIVLMMEERREVSEDLFGEIMDFSAGPTQGERGDRARDAIEWMRNDFLTRLRDFLTSDQNAAWGRHLQANDAQRNAVAVASAAAAPRRPQTQYVRINNNVFTAEDVTYRFGQGGGGRPATEVIERGGTGAFHGTMQLLVKDESLNARNPFAHNKPPYQERQGSIDISGPIVPNRLTMGFLVRQNEAENVDTIHATLPNGGFDLGIIRPAVTRYFSPRGTYQLSQRNSITFNVAYEPYTRKNEGIGGFTLEERASDTTGNNWTAELRQFSALSAQNLYETRFKVTSSFSETQPRSSAVRINVLDAFNSGGAQNASDSTDRTYEFGNLYSRFGERLTIKAGFEGAYRANRTNDTSNFGGTFTFSTLDSYLSGRPLNYRVNRGDPFLRATQLETSVFMQNDLKLNSQFTLMYGARYDAQTNLPDHGNVSPRLGFAYAPGRAMVIRGGAGFFFNRLSVNIVEAQQRLNGTRQYEIVIDNPSFPDAFLAGTVRNTLPSVRVTSPVLEAPYVKVAMVSFERTFAANLFFSANFDTQREFHRFRLRNLNAPYDATSSFPRSCRSEQALESCIRPDPSRGNIMSLESSGNELRNVLRLSLRKRFDLFNVTMNYTAQKVRADSAPGGTGDVPTDNYNLALDWGSAGGFPNHQFSGTVNAQLPLGVFLTGTMSTNSGRHYNITTGRDDNRDTQVNDRPAGVARNSGHAAEQLLFGFNISKAFFFDASTASTRKNLNVFANMTNAFNRTNFGNPSGVMTSPNFGKPTSANDPREIEVGMRYQF
jgi:hypothetical protein